MSTYRKVAPSLRNTDDIRSDVYAIETTKASLISRTTPQIRVAADEHKHPRKATPASIPLRRTLKWAESLPPRVRPTNLLRHFARVANLIAATWASREQCTTYIESLLTDKRGNRQGFPPHVVAELSVLEAYRLAKERDSPWATASKRR